MAKLVLNRSVLFQGNNYKQAYKALIDDIKDAEFSIIIQLVENLSERYGAANRLQAERQQHNPAWLQAILAKFCPDNFEEKANNGSLLYDPSYFPSQWAHTSRAGASKIVLDPRDRLSLNDKSFHEQVKSALVDALLLAKTRIDNKQEQKKVVRMINNAIVAQEALRKQIKPRMLLQLQNLTLESMKETIDTAYENNQADFNALENAISVIKTPKSPIKHFEANDAPIPNIRHLERDGLVAVDPPPREQPLQSPIIQTRKQVNQHHRNIKNLYQSFKTLIKHLPRVNPPNEENPNDAQLVAQVTAERNAMLNGLNEQWCVLGKRWLDPIYKSPKEKDKQDNRRKWLKRGALFLAIPTAILAFVFFITNPHITLSVFIFSFEVVKLLGWAAALLGLYPFADTLTASIINFFKSKHGPTHKQVSELGIGTVSVLLLTAGMAGLGVLGKTLSTMGRVGEKVAHCLNLIKNVFLSHPGHAILGIGSAGYIAKINHFIFRRKGTKDFQVSYNSSNEIVSVSKAAASHLLGDPAEGLLCHDTLVHPLKKQTPAYVYTQKASATNIAHKKMRKSVEEKIEKTYSSSSLILDTLVEKAFEQSNDNALNRNKLHNDRREFFNLTFNDSIYLRKEKLTALHSDINKIKEKIEGDAGVGVPQPIKGKVDKLFHLVDKGKNTLEKIATEMDENDHQAQGRLFLAKL